MIRKISLLVALASFGAGAQTADQSRKAEYVDRAEVTPHGLAPGTKVKEIGANSRTFQITFAKGDEVASGLLDFAEKYHLKNSHFTAVGAFDHAVLGWYDLKERAHKKIPIDEEMEVGSFVGNITLDSKGKPVVHAHCVVGLSDGRAMAGHFVEGHVSLVMQVYLVDSEPISSPSASK